MADSSDKRVVLLAMDGSSYADYAFDCKCITISWLYPYCFNEHVSEKQRVCCFLYKLC